MNNEQPSPSNERFSLISLVNVDDFQPLKNENSDRRRRIEQNNFSTRNNYYPKGF
jgi:hypothetical protein